MTARRSADTDRSVDPHEDFVDDTVELVTGVDDSSVGVQLSPTESGTSGVSGRTAPVRP
jgi:hypothetical protein